MKKQHFFYMIIHIFMIIHPCTHKCVLLAYFLIGSTNFLILNLVLIYGDILQPATYHCHGFYCTCTHTFQEPDGAYSKLDAKKEESGDEVEVEEEEEEEEDPYQILGDLAPTDLMQFAYQIATGMVSRKSSSTVELQ